MSIIDYVWFLYLLFFSVVYYNIAGRVIDKFKNDKNYPWAEIFSSSIPWVIFLTALLIDQNFREDLVFIYHPIVGAKKFIGHLQNIPTFPLMMLLLMSSASTIKNILSIVREYPEEIGIPYAIKKGGVSNYLSAIGWNIIMALYIILPLSMAVMSILAFR